MPVYYYVTPVTRDHSTDLLSTEWIVLNTKSSSLQELQILSPQLKSRTPTSSFQIYFPSTLANTSSNPNGTHTSLFLRSCAHTTSPLK